VYQDTNMISLITSMAIILSMNQACFFLRPRIDLAQTVSLLVHPKCYREREN